MSEISDNRLSVLNDMLLCSADCAGDFAPAVNQFQYEEDVIDWLYHNLPTVPYVVSQIVSLIFSNGLTTGDEAQDEKLNDFLYAKNVNGVTNFSVIQEGIKQALVFGKHGLRWLSDTDGLVSVESKRYGTLSDENEEYYGFRDVIGYLVAIKNVKMWDTDVDELYFDREAFERAGVLVDKDSGLMILSKDDFLNLRNDTNYEDGDSPLRYDLQRTKLLTAIYERLNYDIEYDGPGRIILRLKDGYDSGENEASTTTVLNTSVNAVNARRNKAKQEAAALGKEIKDSKSDNVIVVSNMFDENIEHLPRVTKATEFFDIIEYEGEIICQIMGVPSTLLNMGDIAGNVSMEKILDNAMLNSVVPLREKFSTQISGFLAEKIGVEKIYFDKYEMAEVTDENDRRTKVVNMIQRLELAGHSELANMFDEMLVQDISDGAGGIKKMSARFTRGLRKLFTRKGAKHEQ